MTGDRNIAFFSIATISSETFVFALMELKFVFNEVVVII